MNDEKQSSAGIGQNGEREKKKPKRFGTRQKIRVFKNGKTAEMDEKGLWRDPYSKARGAYRIIRKCNYCGEEYPAAKYLGNLVLFCGQSCIKMGRPGRIPDEERFFNKVVKHSNGCWIYTGTPAQVYGTFKIKGQELRAHRYSYELVNGPIPEGMCACHKCDTPKCVNPDHIFIGTNKDNTLDCVRKGRMADRHGENCGTAVLTSERVTEIRNGPRNNDRFQELAQTFGVTPKHIKAVYRGDKWKHLLS